MKELVGKSQKFVRVEVSDDEAKKRLAHEPYKLEAHWPKERRCW
jgi:threonyl-tRNA synthetase